MTLPSPVDPDSTYVLLSDVLNVLDGFQAAGLTSPASIVDALYARLQELRPRPVPEGGRLVVVELHDPPAGDLQYIEATRHLSTAAALRWCIGTATAECVERERLSRKLARALGVDLLEARGYVDGDRTELLSDRPVDSRLV